MHLVTKLHHNIYPDPIRIVKGERLILSGKTDNWRGHQWLWARADDGREGWVPDNLPVDDGTGVCAAYNYSAMELSAEKGELVKVLDKNHGWAWCENSAANEGWIPLEVLDPR